jgi:hypothetical protein
VPSASNGRILERKCNGRVDAPAVSTMNGTKFAWSLYVFVFLQS